MAYNIFFGGIPGYAHVDKLQKEVLKLIPDANFVFFGDLPLEEDKFIEVAQSADVVISQFQRMTDRIYSSLSNLKGYVCLGIGFDCADVKSAQKHKKWVSNNPGFCVDEVATHAITMLLCCQRHMFPAVNYIRGGNWGVVPDLPQYRFSGCTVGLFGMGSIGRSMAKKLSGFDVTILAVDPFANKEDLAKQGIELVTLDEMLSRSDFVSLHAPATESTSGLFNRETFKKMKPDSWLINTARGALVKSEDLYHALINGDIAGAALDVLENEPPSEIERNLVKLENVLITGHAAFYSETAFEQARITAARACKQIIAGEKPKYSLVQ